MLIKKIFRSIREFENQNSQKINCLIGYYVGDLNKIENSKEYLHSVFHQWEAISCKYFETINLSPIYTGKLNQMLYKASKITQILFGEYEIKVSFDLSQISPEIVEKLKLVGKNEIFPINYRYYESTEGSEYIPCANFVFSDIEQFYRFNLELRSAFNTLYCEKSLRFEKEPKRIIIKNDLEVGEVMTIEGNCQLFDYILEKGREQTPFEKYLNSALQ